RDSCTVGFGHARGRDDVRSGFGVDTDTRIRSAADYRLVIWPRSAPGHSTITRSCGSAIWPPDRSRTTAAIVWMTTHRRHDPMRPRHLMCFGLDYKAICVLGLTIRTC